MIPGADILLAVSTLICGFAIAGSLAAWVDKRVPVVALAVLMPVVASMGGIAGTQTLTLVIRAVALGQVATRNARALLIKELRVGALNGLLWALVVGGVARDLSDGLGLACNAIDQGAAQQVLDTLVRLTCADPTPAT